MENIQNYDIYLTKMSKTFFDKAWFMSHLTDDVKTIVDFGCADGSFMKFLKVNCPCYNYIGIDNDSKFIDMTKNNGFVCYESLKELTNNSNIDKNNACLVLNSVLHEIYSYESADEFWKEVKENHPKYIAIRDMMFNPIDKARFYLPNKDANKIFELFENKCGIQWNDFYEFWKDIQNDELKITQFLLKYFYKENWIRESREFYLPIDIDDLHVEINKLGYRIDFQAFYKLPYLVNKWKNDFELDKNLELNEFIRNINTHYKMLLVRED